MRAIGKALSALIVGMTVFGGAAIMMMMIHIAADVTGRYFFNAPLPATIAIVSNYYMVVAAFIPLALAQKRDMHISVEVAMQVLPQNIQRHAYNLARIYSATIFLLLTYTSWIQAETKRAAGSYVMELGFKVPVWPGYYLLPIGFFVIFLVLVYQVTVYFTGGKSGLGDVDPWTSGDGHQTENI